jgi:SAM-dependent methyltransferase
MAHALEFHDDPHQILREVERVLIPEGELIITGFNPISIWGLRQRLPNCPGDFPWNGITCRCASQGLAATAGLRG